MLTHLHDGDYWKQVKLAKKLTDILLSKNFKMNFNWASEKMSEFLGIPEDRAIELEFYSSSLINIFPIVGIEVTSKDILEVLLAYATNDAEIAFLSYAAGLCAGYYFT